ncbi:C4-dicarboxylate ABC transporter substrate-binding protein [Sulfitobacter sp. SK012]|uniref:TAXI family TRAP transporter solute-binding subunit n=1 Tax=Sulfitobacter sp. SK012 TaxID=1389005 RepID=UPI000E0C272A|nr:TAXI family TRAP transporter solute-binding subunit [Sulfitobacter sp. SK012]AXI47567.1 C4-dicarboxylate ABC transporter substrate-binding protein [Sulfitobacter sp. SK012]
MHKLVLNCLRKAAISIAIILAFGLAPLPAVAENKSIVISSGGPTGVYYPVSVAICRLYNVKYSFLGHGCTVELSGGSIDNLMQLRADKVDFAIVQSDWQAHAKNGTDTFADVGAHVELRSVFALYTESFTVVARANSGINNFQDLLGKRVNIGNAGSGQRATMEVLMDQHGWNRFDFASTREFASDLQAQALCDNEVDAIVFMAGHPSGTIKTATGTCDTKLVSITGPEIDKLLETSDHYRASIIPAGTYFGQTEDISTFGVSATMVTTSDQQDESVLRLVEVVFEKFDRLKRLHTALTNLDAVEMQKDIMPASLHDAASSFYSTGVN